MKCIILAAGYATRLYPLTENFPKPLLKVGEKAILDWLIDDIKGLVDEFIVICNHKFVKQFQSWADKHTPPITVLDDGTTSNETRRGAVKDNLLWISWALMMMCLYSPEIMCWILVLSPSYHLLKRITVPALCAMKKMIWRDSSGQRS